MDLIELGYQTVLVDLGIVKVAGAGAKVMGVFKKMFGKGAPIKKMPSTRMSHQADRAAAGLRPPKPLTAKGYRSVDSAMAGRTFKPKPAAPPSATTAAGPTPPQNPAAGGLLAKIKRNPLKSVGIAGLGAGGLGYTMGQGAPLPDPAMQYYDQQQMGY